MTLSRSEHAQLEHQMQILKDAGVPFAMATIVRTVDATSAKPGGKALLDGDGNILMGWVGGGCARSAVGKAARDAISQAAPQFISLRPQELLDSDGLEAGETRDGIRFARNGCPSRGTMDIFVEPVLPLPELMICGTGLVAIAIAELGARFDFKVSLCTDQADTLAPSPHFEIVQGYNLAADSFVVVATQGQNDLQALRAAASADLRYLSFVGSSKKFATLSAQLKDAHPDLAVKLDRIKAPAGLDINAITPNEIALSILSEITQLRRARRADKGHGDD